MLLPIIPYKQLPWTKIIGMLSKYSAIIEKMWAHSEYKNAGVPVIMLTANAVAGAREQFLEEGFTDYLSKPFSLSGIQGILMKYIPKEKIKTL